MARRWSYRDMADATGVGHATIRRLERCEINNPSDSTLAGLAPLTSHTFEQLKAIGTERISALEVGAQTAEDLLPQVIGLSNEEKGRLAQMIVAQLAQIESISSQEGAHLRVQLMSKEQLAEILHAIADRIQEI